MDEILSEAEVTMLLNTYMYFNYGEATDGQSVKEIINTLPSDVMSEHKKEYAILSDAINNPQVGDLKITCQAKDMGYNKGTNAATFINEADDKVYVIFRGTGDGEWYDNGSGLSKAETAQQKEAVEYFDEVVKTLNINDQTKLYAGGHSKGGNKVQYITMESKNSDLITATYSVDGQAHSDAAIKKWKKSYSQDEYAKRVSKIYGINGANDFISVLGTSIILKENISYIDTPIEGNNIIGFHDITNMYAKRSVDKNGNEELKYSAQRNDYVLRRGDFADWVRELSEDVMAMPTPVRSANAHALMQLMEFTKGSPVGVHGELATAMDFKVFGLTGLVTILTSAFSSKEGLKVLEDFNKKNEFAQSFEGATDIKVNYVALRETADNLMDASNKLSQTLASMGAVGAALPLYLDGSIYRKPNFDNSLIKLKELQLKLKKLSNAEQKIAQLYESFDNMTL